MNTARRGLWLLLLWPLIGFAHKPSDSYLMFDLDGTTLAGQWDIALRDLEYAIGLDADQDGVITWGELQARHLAIAQYALARLKIGRAGQACVLQPIQHLVDNHSDGAYAVLRFTSSCATDQPLTVDYRLFFDLDPSHRGLLRIVRGSTTETAVLGPAQSTIELKPSARGPWATLADFWREGVWHIAIGFDHVLFVLSLLLPSVLWRANGRWREAESLRAVMLDVAAIITAFTVAHALTLSAAVLGWIHLPSRWVEAAIAATVVLAALNNLYPVVHGRRWLVAFGFGLVHGLGFASTLADMNLPGGALALALVGFNLGVESGQFIIVAILLPAAFVLRDSWFYRRIALQTGSLTVAAIASLWLVERGLNLKLITP
ncbi:MAG: HupE/UreJ family protein [Gammaproteobacteria bacterium]